MPGPYRRPLDLRNGIERNVPDVQTVSEWPSVRMRPDFFFPGSFISQTTCFPNEPPGNVRTAAKGETVSETSSTKRLTAAGLSLGDSHSTNSPIVAIISG